MIHCDHSNNDSSLWHWKYDTEIIERISSLNAKGASKIQNIALVTTSKSSSNYSSTRERGTKRNTNKQNTFHRVFFETGFVKWVVWSGPPREVLEVCSLNKGNSQRYEKCALRSENLHTDTWLNCLRARSVCSFKRKRLVGVCRWESVPWEIVQLKSLLKLPY